MEKKGLRENAGKTKVMICGTGLDLLQGSLIEMGYTSSFGYAEYKCMKNHV